MHFVSRHSVSTAFWPEHDDLLRFDGQREEKASMRHERSNSQPSGAASSIRANDYSTDKGDIENARQLSLSACLRQSEHEMNLETGFARALALQSRARRQHAGDDNQLDTSNPHPPQAELISPDIGMKGFLQGGPSAWQCTPPPQTRSFSRWGLPTYLPSIGPRTDGTTHSHLACRFGDGLANRHRKAFVPLRATMLFGLPRPHHGG